MSEMDGTELNYWGLGGLLSIGVVGCTSLPYTLLIGVSSVLLYGSFRLGLRVHCSEFPISSFTVKRT